MPVFYRLNDFGLDVPLGIDVNLYLTLIFLYEISIKPSYAREIMPRETADQLVNAFQLNFIFNNFFSNLAKSFK